MAVGQWQRPANEGDDCHWIGRIISILNKSQATEASRLIRAKSFGFYCH